MGFPISKQNQLQLEKADKEALENLKNVTTIFGFCRYLEQKKLVNIITEKQLENIKNKFWTLLKDENTKSEPPHKAVCQAIAYATFLRELIRSESGQKWWNFFGFGGNIPKELSLKAIIIMPCRNKKGFVG